MTKAYTEKGGIFGLEGNSNYLTTILCIRKYFPNGYIKPISEKVTAVHYLARKEAISNCICTE